MIILVNNREQPFRQWRFSGGEIGFRFLDPSTVFHDAGSTPTVGIRASLLTADDLVALFLAGDALRRLWDAQSPHAQSPHTLAITVTIPYLPYARQDRVCAPGESWSLAVIATLLNAQQYAAVRVWDVHSPVAERLIQHCTSVAPQDIAAACRALFAGDHILVAPDAGAAPRVRAVAAAVGRPMIAAQKRRDPATGAILDTILDLDADTLDRIRLSDCLIVDDICDGGRTFIELARKLKPLTQGRIALYVTHGIFSQGLDLFDGLIDRIYCPNVWPTIGDHPILVRL